MRLIRIAAAVAGLALVGCGPKVASIDVAPKAVVLKAKGDKVALKATALDADGKPVPGVALTFLSSDPAVASVDASGNVVAVKSGKVTLTVGFESKVTMQLPATVNIVASISVAPSEAKLAPGGTVEVAAKVMNDAGAEAAAKISWETENPAVAEVSDGRITAVGPGSTKVYAVVGEIKGPVAVTVEAPAVASVDVPKKMEVTAGVPTKIPAKAKTADGKEAVGAPLLFKTLDAKIAVVNGAGEVSGMKVGKAKIEVMSGPKKAVIEVTVKKAPAAKSAGKTPPKKGKK